MAKLLQFVIMMGLSVFVGASMMCPNREGFDTICTPVRNARFACVKLPDFVIFAGSPCTVDFEISDYPISKPCKITYK